MMLNFALRLPILRGLSQPGINALSDTTFHRRRHFLTFLLCVAFLGAAARLANFALEDAESIWAAWNGAETESTFEFAAPLHSSRYRAQIHDRQNQVLASNLDVKVLCHRPGEVSDPERTARVLGEIIPSANVEILTQRLRGDRAWLTHEVSPLQQQKIHEAYLEGIEFCDDQRRVYPYGALFAHTIGFTDSGNQGLTGMERRLNLQIQNSATPIKTTLDATVQDIISVELERQIQKFEAIGGVAILMRANTSEVVSLVSLPSFDPVNVVDASDPNLFNRATKGVYELGSVMKPFTVAAALNDGLIDVGSPVDVTRDIIINGYPIGDFPGTPKGIFTVAEVIEKSSNIGTARIADLLGPERQQHYLRNFGFTRAAELELAEIASPLTPTTWGRTQTMTIGFGHGISVTPLQLVAAEAALVNGGVYRRPTLLSTTGPHPEGTRVISEEVSALTRSMLRRVAVFGSGKNANAAGYIVGGKTGTAEKHEVGGYNEDARIASFLGAFPIHEPEYILLVSIDEPKPQEDTFGYATGGWVAAPAFARIIEQIGPYLGIERLSVDPYGYEEIQIAATMAPEQDISPVITATSRSVVAPAATVTQTNFIESVIVGDDTIF
ncbi:MAG: peptidoglycan D,D-transpeptidase FtsI family protein [Alphaproteobacteria bacterium]